RAQSFAASRVLDAFATAFIFDFMERGLMSDLTRRDLIRSGLALSGSTLVPGAVSRAQALLARYPETAAEDLVAAGPRERLRFDFGWRFFQGHASDSLRDLGFGQDQGDFAKSGEFKFATEKFDDS